MKGFKIANLITNIIAFVYAFSFCGLVGTCLMFLLYFTNATGAYDSRIFDIFLFRGEYLILGYTFFCALELILTILSRTTGNTKQAETLKV